ncbi:MAG: hypothetical protein JSW08_03120 [archaeon]|nr:MAG: hypothetical protein JSW08_03120 [archaeon]
MRIGGIIFASAIVVFLVLGFSALIWEWDTIPEHYDKCYDRYGNEIVGQQCFVEEYRELTKSGVTLIIMSIILGFALSIIGAYLNSRDI